MNAPFEFWQHQILHTGNIKTANQTMPGTLFVVSTSILQHVINTITLIYCKMLTGDYWCRGVFFLFCTHMMSKWLCYLSVRSTASSIADIWQLKIRTRVHPEDCVKIIHCFISAVFRAAKLTELYNGQLMMNFCFKKKCFRGIFSSSVTQIKAYGFCFFHLSTKNNHILV